MAYWLQQDLERSIGKDAVAQLCCDDGQSVADPDIIAELQDEADGRVDAGLATVYPGPFPVTQSPLPRQIKIASLLFGKALAYGRRTEYVKTHSEPALKAAESYLEALVEAKEYIVGLLNAGTPANVGGLVVSNGPRMLTDNADGTDNLGDF